jgi:hypothetical protein
VHAVAGNREDGAHDVALIAIEYLDDVPVGIGLLKLQDILTGFQNRIPDLYGLVHCQDSTLVPFVRLGTVCGGGHCEYRCGNRKHCSQIAE